MKSSQNSKSAGYGPIPRFSDPYRVHGLAPEDRELIDYLDNIHRGRDSGPDQSQSRLLSRIPELEAWVKSRPNRHHERILKKLLEGQSSDGATPLMLYPLVDGDNPRDLEISPRIVVAFDQTGPGSAKEQIDSLRNVNAASFDRIFAAAFDAPRHVTADYEDRPGGLLGADQGELPDYSLLSTEQSVLLPLHARIGAQGLQGGHIDFFRRDMEAYLKSSPALNEFFPGLFLPTREGIYAHEEIVFCYRVLADALESFARTRASELFLMSALGEFDKAFPPEAGRRQARERVQYLLNILENQASGPVVQSLPGLRTLIELIHKLIAEMGRQFEKRAAEEVMRKTKDVAQMVREQSASTRTPTLVRTGEMFARSVFKDPDERARYSRQVVERLKEMEELGYVPAGEDEAFYFVHIPLLFRMEAEYTKKGDQEGMTRIRALIEALPALRPGTQDYREVLRDYNPELYAEAMKMIGAAEKDRSNQSDRARREFQQQLSVSGHLAGGLTALGGVALYGSLSTMDPLIALNVGIFTYLAGFGITHSLLKSRFDSAGAGGKGGGRAGKATGTAGKNNGGSDPALSLLDQLFSDSGNPARRVFTRSRFMELIEALPEIQSLTDDAARKDAVESNWRAVQSRIQMISIPRQRVPRGESSTYILDRRDIKNNSARSAIIAHFRDKATGARKSGGEWNPDQADYFDFIAAQIEASALKRDRTGSLRG